MACTLPGRQKSKEHVRHFKFKNNPCDPANSAQHLLDGEIAALTRDDWIDQPRREIKLAAWCVIWIEGYARNRDSTLRQGKTHVKRIKAHFGQKKLRAVEHSDVRAWIVALCTEGLADSTIYALHARLVQVYGEAMEDGYLIKSPAGRRTSPPMGKQRAYVATTVQVWALNDAMPAIARKVVPLAVFAGLRAAEAVVFAPVYLDAVNHVAHPTFQYLRSSLSYSWKE